jgi:hypothetical protein
MHTFPLENSLQDVGGESQRTNCGLKYVISTSSQVVDEHRRKAEPEMALLSR